MVLPVVLAGGKGMRLWPMSRDAVPKPFMPIAGEGSTLFQSTIRRLSAVGGLGAPLVVCNAAHEFLARQQAAGVIGEGLSMLLEPEGRNTAPALCAAALVAQRVSGTDEPMLVLPADHIIVDEAAFAEAVRSGTDLACKGFLVTFSVKPTDAATGYGYLKLGEPIDRQQGQFRLDAFVEKPDRETAQSFLASGLHAWNSGMFVFAPSVLIAAFRELRPEILEACTKAVAQCSPGAVMKLDAKAFAGAPSISIDNAILEKAPNVATVVADLGWSDVGDWEAIWQIASKDGNGVAGRGNILALDSRDSLIQSNGPLLVGLGLENMIAVATEDAVVVAPRHRSQDVRTAVDRLSALGRREVVAARKVPRPWGSFEQLHVGPGFQVKRISVNPGAKLSLQPHKFRAEHWVCIAGQGVATRGEERIAIGLNQAIDIPPGASHRLENPGPDMLHIIEVQIGSDTGEDDIERFEDIYGGT